MDKKAFIDTAIENRELEICVLCGKITDIPKSKHIDLRQNYIIGAGQLCPECAYQLKGKGHE